MRFHILLLLIFSASVLPMSAQTIVEHLQKTENGQGKVTVKHSKEIDELVNPHKSTQQKVLTPSQQKAITPAQQKPSTHVKTEDNKAAKKTDTAQHPDSTASDKTDEEKKNDDADNENKAETHRRTPTHTENEAEIASVDTRKKVLRNAHKVTGYRVQVFSGGSNRTDREKAQKAANKVKAKYPQLPVYVHFYSPSWKCRVGNFRTYAEANKVLKQIKAMGYSQACIVKGQITVQ